MLITGSVHCSIQSAYCMHHCNYIIPTKLWCVTDIMAGCSYVARDNTLEVPVYVMAQHA